MAKTIIMLHCSATKETVDTTYETIEAGHKVRGFREIGYHYYIRKDGSVQQGREEHETGAHCVGYNSTAIGICYEGGLDENGKTKDTRTIAQKRAIPRLIAKIMERHPITRICGHRDVSPDTDGNGKVDSYEWLKACPCFNAETEYKQLLP